MYVALLFKWTWVMFVLVVMFNMFVWEYKWLRNVSHAFWSKVGIQIFPNFAFKNIIKNGQNTLYLAFNFHLKICLDLDFAPFDKVVEFKFLNNFYFGSNFWNYFKKV